MNYAATDYTALSEAPAGSGLTKKEHHCPAKGEYSPRVSDSQLLSELETANERGRSAFDAAAKHMEQILLARHLQGLRLLARLATFCIVKKSEHGSCLLACGCSFLSAVS